MLNRPLSIRDTVAAAPIHMEPFPHIIVPNVLPADVMTAVLKHWPAEKVMDPEHTGGGGLGRFMYPILANRNMRSRAGVLRRHLRLRNAREILFWQRFAAESGALVVKAALSRFVQFNAARFGDASYWTDLVLFESGPTFEQHAAHTHHNHNPGWAMTFLLFLDDGGRDDRGEVFSAPSRHADWLDVVAAADHKRLPLWPMKRIPFAPNTLLAWLDGPMSFHGTDKLALDPINRRRMLRCHAGANEFYVRRSLGIDSRGFMEACAAHRAGDSAALRRILSRPGNCVDALPRFSYVD